MTRNDLITTLISGLDRFLASNDIQITLGQGYAIDYCLSVTRAACDGPGRNKVYITHVGWHDSLRHQGVFKSIVDYLKSHPDVHTLGVANVKELWFRKKLNAYGFKGDHTHYDWNK